MEETVTKNTPLTKTHMFQIYGAITFMTIGIVMLGVLSFIYSIETVINGIINHPHLVIFYLLIPIAVIPSYSSSDNRITKLTKQLGWTTLILGIGSGVISLYGFTVQDPTPAEDFTFWLSKNIFGLTLFTAIIEGWLLNGEHEDIV